MWCNKRESSRTFSQTFLFSFLDRSWDKFKQINSIDENLFNREHLYLCHCSRENGEKHLFVTLVKEREGSGERGLFERNTGSESHPHRPDTLDMSRINFIGDYIHRENAQSS